MFIDSTTAVVLAYAERCVGPRGRALRSAVERCTIGYAADRRASLPARASRHWCCRRRTFDLMLLEISSNARRRIRPGRRDRGKSPERCDVARAPVRSPSVEHVIPGGVRGALRSAVHLILAVTWLARSAAMCLLVGAWCAEIALRQRTAGERGARNVKSVRCQSNGEWPSCFEDGPS